MNNTLKKGLIAASAAILIGNFAACSGSNGSDVSGVTIDPDGIADNTGSESSSSMPSVESSSSMPSVESSSSEKPIASSSSSSIPVIGCKTRSIKGAGYGCAGLMGDIEWFAPDYQLSGKDFEGGDWYDFDDSAFEGDSRIEWNVKEDPESDLDLFSQIIEQNYGLSGRAEIGSNYEYAFAGFGFGVGKPMEGSSEKFMSVDASNWVNICIEYKSTAGFAVQLINSDSLNTYTDNNFYKASFPKTVVSQTKCVSISKDFKQETGWGNTITKEDALKDLAAIEFKFTASADFYIRGIAIGLK